MQIKNDLWLLISFATSLYFTSLSVSSSENQTKSQFSQWHFIGDSLTGVVIDKETSEKLIVTTDFSVLKQLLLSNDHKVIISIPSPDGKLIDVELTPSKIMAKGLAEKYPEIKTFDARQVTAPENKGSFDVTSRGFHGMLNVGSDVIFIEPSKANALNEYHVYFRSDAKNNQLGIVKQFNPKIFVASNEAGDSPATNVITSANKSDPTASFSLRTYRIAVSATAEYTQYHGGTKASALAEIVTMLNRVNQVFQRDFSIKLELVEDNDKIIFVDKALDPFSNDNSDSDKNTAVINEYIGSNNYDVGHVVSTGAGGIAALSSVCNLTHKGNGVTGTQAPVNDSFYIDYVAHELGHQFGANHSFNGTEDLCFNNRVYTAAFEPGSGSSIMGYVGICGSQNLQEKSDPYFNAYSIDEVNAFTASMPECGEKSNISVNSPVVDAGDNYTIPAHTPFTLKGSAESSSESLTYSWEQYDLGNLTTSRQTQVDDGSRPLFRVFPPTNEPVRTFPKLSSILQGINTIGESYAKTNRELNFRLLVRDSNGGTAVDHMKINVINTGQAFKITSPSNGDVWQDAEQSILWDVAGTDLAPISCPYLDIYKSEDDGNTFDLLASNVVNDGEYTTRVVDFDSTSARLKIACRDNIFFNISEGTFSAYIIDVPDIVGQEELIMSINSELTLIPTMFYYEDVVADTITVSPGLNYSARGSSIVPERDFTGTLSVNINATAGESGTSKTYIAKVIVEGEEDKSSGGVTYLFIFSLLFSVMYRLVRRS